MSIEVEAIDFAGFAVGVTGEDLDGDGDEGWALKTCRNRERPVGFNFFFSFLLMIINYRRSSRSRGNMCGGKDVEGESQSQGTRLDLTPHSCLEAPQWHLAVLCSYSKSSSHGGGNHRDFIGRAGSKICWSCSLSMSVILMV